ncbi:MAG: hypothetical protein ABL961_03725 [Vicinamibacterales bacterium]
MVRRDVLATSRRLGIVALGLTVGLLSASSSFAQAPAAAGQPVPNQRLFANDGAMVLNFIKPDKTADFELVVDKLKEALAKSEKPERKQQAAGWKVFKSPDPAGANVLYVFIIDPALKGADYQVSNIIAEAFTGPEATDILTKYAGAYAQGMNIVNLNLLKKLGE